MSRAEEISQNRYPTLAEKYAFIDGYEQAEKDMELTWEDVEKITDIWDDLHEDETVYIKTGYDTHEFYKEILKQFKNYKEKEEREEK